MEARFLGTAIIKLINFGFVIQMKIIFRYLVVFNECSSVMSVVNSKRETQSKEMHVNQ